MIGYEEVLGRLNALADESYRAFHQKLLKNERINVIGVRMPVLRKLAEEWKGELNFLLSFPDEYYEVTFLKCAVAGKQTYEAFTAVVNGLVPLLDNWATCDCFEAPCIGAHREEFLPYVCAFLEDGREFVVRYALVTLLRYYTEPQYLPLIFEAVSHADPKKYYVMTAAAWLTAEVLVKYYGDGVAFLKEGRLSKEVRNTAIRKARESCRLSAGQKEELRFLKM